MESERNESQGNLRLDRVLSSQPELGPSVPDGGYGWIILICAFLVQLMVPSIICLYGILIVFWVEETSVGEEEVALTVARTGGLGVCVVVHAASWTVSGPASRILVHVSKWPRLSATAGVCTTAAGLLATWLTLAHNASELAFLPGAIATGLGTSLTLIQSDTLICQYFQKRLPMVKTILWCGRSTGYFFTPLIAGLIIRNSGILHGLLVYQTVLLQLVICMLVYRKPPYLKAKRRTYELLQNSQEEEDLVYPSNGTEMMTTSSPKLNGASSSSALKNLQQSGPHTSSSQPPAFNLLKDSFSEDFRTDLAPKVSTMPTPIYEETTHIQSNIVNDIQDIHLQGHEQDLNWKEKWHFLIEGPFYRSWLMKTTVCYAALVLWAFFPTYLYFNRLDLNLKKTCLISGAISTGAFLCSLFSQFLPTHGEKRKHTLAAFCFTGAIGFFLISEGVNVLRGTVVIGGCLATLSITGLQINPISSKRKFASNADVSIYRDTHLNVMVAISLAILLLSQDLSLRNCFRLASLLNVILGSVMLSSVFYKRIKNIFIPPNT